MTDYRLTKDAGTPMERVRTFQDAQREFVKEHPHAMMGTALPDAELMRSMTLADAVNDLAKRLDRIEQHLGIAKEDND